MTGKTITRADLCEAVYQKVGLSRTESATLVELVLKEITDCLERGETVKLSSFGSFVVRKKGQRIGRNPKTGKEVPISPRRVMVFKPSAILKQRINSDGTTASRADKRGTDKATWLDKAPDAFRTISEVATTSTCRSTCCGSGKAVSANQADEARRRPALLPPRRRRPAARHPPSALWRGLHDPRRAAHPEGSRRQVRAERLEAGCDAARVRRGGGRAGCAAAQRAAARGGRAPPPVRPVAVFPCKRPGGGSRTRRAGGNPLRTGGDAGTDAYRGRVRADACRAIACALRRPYRQAARRAERPAGMPAPARRRDD